MDKPLGLPVGSVRAIMAVMALLALIIASLISGQEKELVQTLQGVVFAVIGFYYGERSGAKNGNGNNNI